MHFKKIALVLVATVLSTAFTAPVSNNAGMYCKAWNVGGAGCALLRLICRRRRRRGA